MSTTTHPTTDAPGATPRAGARGWTALAVLVLPVLLVAVDGTILAFALPEISAALRPSATQQLWIVDAYPLVLAGLLVTAGWLGDRLGRRRVLLAGAAGFGLVSLLAATAHTAAQLVAARAALGLFGATLMPSTLALLRNVFLDRRQRRTAMAVWAAGFSGGAALGPVVGGWLLEHHPWPSVFLVNVPVMLVLLVAGRLLLPESRDPAPGRLDVASVVLSLATAAPVVHGVKHLAHDGLDAVSVGALALGTASGVVFVRRQHRLAHPLLDVALFRLPVFRTAVLANLMSVLALTGLLYCLSQQLQLVLGASPV
ncbi:MFS transporter, partial [Kineococcus glutinatus]|uniref:MFS transporter n=1 Tax=Kineococcus glutinatus TaxID=1070872 RepID=UPI0031F156CB